MQDGDFAYDLAPAGAATACVLAIYGDRPHLRAALRDDARAAGANVAVCGTLAELAEAAEWATGDGRSRAFPVDVVLVDCPCGDARTLAALARLDMVAAASGRMRLVVSTGVGAIDAVFGCMDQSQPFLLVDPDRAERVIALAQVLAAFPMTGVRDLSEDDRSMLLRLTEQVGRIAGRIGLDMNGAPRAGAGMEATAQAPPPAGAAGASSHAPVHDARQLRRLIRQRQLRTRFFDAGLFADPAWDMLLDLAASRIEGKAVSVSSLCIAAGVPPTTALRWIGQMVDAGLFVRIRDAEDRRRAFIALSDRAAEAMGRYMAEVVPGGPVAA